MPVLGVGAHLCAMRAEWVPLESCPLPSGCTPEAVPAPPVLWPCRCQEPSAEATPFPRALAPVLLPKFHPYESPRHSWEQCPISSLGVVSPFTQKCSQGEQALVWKPMLVGRQSRTPSLSPAAV